jgi:hypothetical protein
LSTSDIIPSFWLPLIQIAGFIGVVVTILILSVRITRYITQVEGATTTKNTEVVGKINNEATRLDGRINQLEERINGVRDELHMQRSELQSYFLRNGEIMMKIGEMMERGRRNVEPDRERKETD